MPSLLRRKSTMRRWCLWPPPWCRMVTRPWLLRPLPRDCGSTSGLYGSPLCSSGVTTFTRARRPGEVGLTLTSGMALFRGCEVDFLPRRKPHVGLLPVAAPPERAAEAPLLAADVEHGHRVDLGLEHQLHRRLDLGLGGMVGDAEYVLAVLVGHEGALLRDHRREHDIHQAVGCVLFHFSSSSSLASAAFVTSTCG